MDEQHGPLASNGLILMIIDILGHCDGWCGIRIKRRLRLGTSVDQDFSIDREHSKKCDTG